VSSRNELVRKATRLSNSYFLVNIFYSIQRNECYSCEIWTVDYTLKKGIFSAEMDLWRSVGTSAIIKVRNEVIRGKMGVNSVELGTRYVEMALPRVAHGVTGGLSRLKLTLTLGRRKRSEV
jgi:hypothetical protein